MRPTRVTFSVSAALLAATSLAWGAGAAREAGTPRFHPANFDRSTKVTNAWFPLKPGTQLIFRGSTTEGNERIPHRVVFTVTDLTKEIGGVRSVVLWDRDYSGGPLVEAEIAFFAQDNGGNVWQTGEYPEEYEDGKILASPLWIHGIQGARAGLTMKAEPLPGPPSYSLGWGPAVGFNDRAKVLRAGEKTCVPHGCYTDVLVTDEFNPDEPGKHQLKYYARGVGNVRVGWSGENEDTKEVLVLVDVRRLGPAGMAEARARALALEKSAYARRPAVYGRTTPAQAP